MRTPDDIHDEWLVLRCQTGDAAALAELVDRWQPRLLRHSLRLTGAPDGAGDVVQAAWVAIIGGLRGLDDAACFRRWAYQIVTHKCADWVRERQRARVASVGSTTEPVHENPAAWEAQDDIAAMRAALRQLPSDQRTALSMFYLDEMPLAEVAEALSLPVGTVKSRLHYGRMKLKEILERTMP